MKRAVLGIVVASTLAVGCAGSPEPAADLAAVAGAMPNPPRRILLIGLDGADWNVARPLMEAGKMPVLAMLVEQGASGDLRSIEPMISPALWTTVATGVGREHHGIVDFVYKERGTYSQPIVNSSVRERLAVWNILSALGSKVGVVDWYATWPAEKVNGFIVSDRIKTLGAEEAGVIYPATGALEPRLAAPPPPTGLPALERLTRAVDALPVGLDKALKEDLYRYGIAKNLYRAEQPDFFAFYLKGIDAVSHFYWKYHEPEDEVFGEVDAAEVRRLGSLVRDYYQLCDQLLGDFLQEVDEDTTLLIASDHGFRAFGRPDSLIFDLDRLFEVMGLLEFEEPRTAALRSEREIRMGATRIYTHEGTEIVSAFGRRDRPVYLNIAGRDPQGVIAQEGWIEARDEIRSRLESLRTDQGSRLFARVEVNDETDRDGIGQPPDLYLRVNGEIAFDHDALIDGKPYPLFDFFIWEYGNISGTHRTDGILVARGPSIRAGARVDGAGLRDITPTILHLAGAPVSEDLDGRVLRAMLGPHAVPSRVRVTSYEPLIEREFPAVEQAPLDEEYRERLRALGYVQ